MEAIVHKPAFLKRLGGDPARFAISLVLTMLVALVLISCAGPEAHRRPAPGVYHIVKKGETAYSIARAYEIDLQELAEVNDISDITNIREGAVLFIPDAEEVIDDVMAAAAKAAGDAGKEVEIKDKPGSDDRKSEISKGRRSQPIVKKPASGPDTSKPVASAVPKPAPDEKPPAVEQRKGIKKESGRFDWPVKGNIKSRFGIQPNKTYHNWIQITCTPGSHIRAAATGIVIFSAPLKNFGQTVILRHTDNFATVYTHLKKRLVVADQTVKKGAKIGIAGEVNDSGDTYINFEIRLGGKARNPLFYLP